MTGNEEIKHIVRKSLEVAFININALGHDVTKLQEVFKKFEASLLDMLIAKEKKSEPVEAEPAKESKPKKKVSKKK